MDNLVPLAAKYWHHRRMQWALPLGAAFATLMVSTGAGNTPIALRHVLFAGGVAAGFATLWHLLHRVPRVHEDRVGIVVAIAGESDRHDEQVRKDFLASLEALLSADAGRTQFQIVVFPRFLAEECQTNTAAAKQLARAGGHFMVFGSVRERQIRGEPSHYVALEGLVSHAPVPRRVSAQLSADFQVALPRRVIFAKDNDALLFEVTSGVTDIAARYVIGLAALVSGDLEYAEMLLLSVEAKLRTTPTRGGQLRDIAKALPSRIEALYTNWLDALADAYSKTGSREYLERTEAATDRLLERNAANYKGLLMKAICCFRLRRDLAGAKRALRACRNITDSTWRYSLAFVYAYEGRMDEAISEYRKAFDSPLDDVTVPLQCETFIQGILEEEPEKGQLHYCAALINRYAKPDPSIAAREYELFVAHKASRAFPALRSEALHALGTPDTEPALEPPAP